jgi:hypothetical protein
MRYIAPKMICIKCKTIQWNNIKFRCKKCYGKLELYEEAWFGTKDTLLGKILGIILVIWMTIYSIGYIIYNYIPPKYIQFITIISFIICVIIIAKVRSNRKTLSNKIKQSNK